MPLIFNTHSMNMIKALYTKFCLAFLIVLAIACEKKEKVNPDLSGGVLANFKIIADRNAYGRIIVMFKMERWNYCSIDYGDGFEGQYSAVSNPDRIPVESGEGVEHIYKENKEYQITLTAYNKSETGEINKASHKQTVRISNIPPKAEADFSYELLDNGAVKFTNLSKNALDYAWRGGSPYYTKTQNPTLIFEKNGIYPITLSANSPFHESTKSVNINITNVKEEQVPTFTGTYLKHKGALKGTGNVRFDGACCDGIPLGIPFFHFTVPDTDIDLILITSSLNLKDYSLADKYKAIKEAAILNKKYVSNNGLMDWWFGVQGIPNDNYSPKTLEIVEVHEIPQAKLIPEMYDKALWITFKIKGDFAEYGKIDGLLKLKYLVY
ncbi:MAG TPA: hypothetical protein VGE24_10625 [Emticicia sp.]